MNLAGFIPIHASNLEVGKEYFLKNRFGEGTVKVTNSSLEGWEVEILEGGFNLPLGKKKFRKGHSMTVADESKFYEMKGS